MTRGSIRRLLGRVLGIDSADRSREPTEEDVASTNSGLFECPDCGTVYIAAEFEECRDCRAAVEAVPNEHDLAMVPAD